MPDGILEYTACIYCDEILRKYVTSHHAQMRVKTQSSSRGGRGRGRRGRGGRGRRGR